MRFSFLLVAVLLLCASAPATAQEVSGRVWVGGNGAAQAVVTIACPQQAPIQATADGNGVYRMSVGGGGCTVQVSFQGKSSNRIPLRVAGRTTANLELTARGNGWSLTRRG